MKRLLFILSVGLFLITTPSVVAAQGEKSQGDEVQNVNQVKTQNQGVESQLQVATQEVEKLMSLDGLAEDVGKKMSELVDEQKQAQSKIGSELEKLNSKSGLMKSLFGPDYGALKSLTQQMEQNQLRIQQLEQLKTQLKNMADQDQVQLAIEALVQQNTALSDSIQEEESTTSLFGWLVKLFN